MLNEVLHYRNAFLGAYKLQIVNLYSLCQKFIYYI